VTTTARLADAMTALYNAFAASSLNPTPAGTPGVTITLGDVPTAAADPEFVIVGHDGTLEPDGSLSLTPEAGSWTAAFIVTGSPPLTEETGQVHCVAVAQSGDTADVAGRVAEAQRMQGACDDACADLTVSGIKFTPASQGRLATRQSGAGFAAVLAFTVEYTAPW